MKIIKKIRRISNKVKREVIQSTPLKFVSELTYRKNLEKHVKCLPKMSLVDSTLVEAVRQEGAFVTSLEALEIPSTSLLVASAKKLLPEILTFPSNGKDSISLPLSKLIKYPEIILWGLEERLLNIVENYIGLPVLYHGANFRREIANGRLADVRQWHIDVEDHRMLKVIVYLNDVGLNGGPFEYISKYSTSSLRQTLQYRSGFVSDKVVETVIPKSDWKSCTGRSGTLTLSDTCNIFHRAKPPLEADRFSITFTYTSRRPITIYSKITVFRDEVLKISNSLSRHQRECILGNRNLF